MWALKLTVLLIYLKDPEYTFLLLAYLQNKNIKSRHYFNKLFWQVLIRLSTVMEIFYNLCCSIW